MSSEQPLRVGFGRVDITPPPGVPYLSLFPRQTPFEGVADRLWARAMVAEAADGQAVAVIAFDGLGLSRGVLGPGRDAVAEFRQRVTAATRIPAAAVMLAASHAHSTPQTTDLVDLLGDFPGCAAWLERLLDQLAAAATAAWACREPAELYWGEGLAPGLAWNRRILTRDGRLVIHRDRPADSEVVKEPRDDRVPVILVKSARRRGALFGFCCHPTTVQVQPLVSADFPGVACEQVERALDLSACLFLQGACGDVGPIRRTTDFADVALYGRSLGGEVTRLLALCDARDATPMRPVVGAASRVIEVPRRDLPAVDFAERERLRQAIDQVAEAERAAAIGAFRRVDEPCRLVSLGTGPVRLEVQAMRLGDALLITNEGEMFSEFGLAQKAASPSERTIIVGYANGYEGYYPTAAAWQEGGYEPSVGPWTRVAPGASEQMAAAGSALAEELWRATEPA